MYPICHCFEDMVSLPERIFSLQFSSPTEIWINTRKGFPGQPHTQKVLVVVEPDAIQKFRPFLFKNFAQFKAILTFDEVLLSQLPNAILFEFGTTWISEYDFPLKKFGVSMVCGPKKQTIGHRLRHQLWKLNSQIQIPTFFYISSQKGGLWWHYKTWKDKKNFPTLGSKKTILFDTQFHLAIENSRTPYYFSEKLMDCFMTKTVPVYWGATKIENYFNPQGMIQIQNEHEALEKLNQLTPETYDTMKVAIEENYHLAQKFAHYEERLVAKLQEVFQ